MGDNNPNSILTEKQRDFLQKSEAERKEDYTRQGRSYHKKEIRERARAALQDFALLADELDEEERNKIFAAEPRTPEWVELEDDVAGVIKFLYVGLGGESAFRRPLKSGVQNGELNLGNVRNPMHAEATFYVDQVRDADPRDVAELIKNKEWDRLPPADITSFLSLAMDADAIAFDKFDEYLDFVEWNLEYQIGKKHRAIPEGKHTPLIERDVYEEEGIGEMSGEELRELFGEGYPAGSNVYYDGEKVLSPPPRGSSDEPEVVEWIHEPNDGDVDTDTDA